MYSLRSLFLFFVFAIASVAAGTNQAGLDFLAAKGKEDGVVKLPSGLMYKELVVGTGKTPTVSSPCSCHYAGTLIDGTEFDSSYKRGAVSSS
jgi:FKBP-type peptidyl-prolyl cis-trans isomerase FklB